MKNAEYKTISANSTKEFSAKIREMLQDGWDCVREPLITGDAKTHLYAFDMVMWRDVENNE